MKKTIENLRNKSKDQKQRFAFVGALVVTVFVFLVWLSVFVNSLDQSTQVAQVESPIDSITGLFIDAFSDN